MNIKFSGTATLLLFSGGLLAVIGAIINLSPDYFYASGGIVLPENLDLRSELRAPSGMLLSIGVLTLVSIVIRNWRLTMLLMTSLVYLSYALSRFIGMLVDGLPSGSIVNAALIELLLGVACLVAWFLIRTRSFQVVVENQ